MVGVVKYFHLLGVLSALIFILCDSCPLVLLSILAFLCLPMWLHDENVDRPHLYHVITWPEMGSYTLMVGVVKYFHLLGVLSALIFILWGCCPMVLLSILAFLCPPMWPAWWECWSSTPVSCDHMTRDGIVHLDGWSSKIFSSFGGFVRLNFLSFGAIVIWCFCPIFPFLCPPTWLHDENVDRPHLYHVIIWPEMGSYTLMVGVVKYFHLLGLLSALIFMLWGCCPMVLLSIMAFLCLPMWPHDENVDRPHLYLCDHIIWCFCPIFLFSVRPRDRMTRMLIVHTCIMWSHDQRWDRTPWWLE